MSQFPRGLNPAVRALLEVVERTPGWTFKHTRAGHYKVFPADRTKRPVILSATPSDHRSTMNDRMQLRRAGLIFRKGH